MNVFTATGHVKTTPERRVNHTTGRPTAFFTLEVEDEVFPGRSRYTVAVIDNDAEYAMRHVKVGSEVFVQGRLRKQADVVTIYARQLSALIR
jgi:single-stranded DNA-binding protein